MLPASPNTTDDCSICLNALAPGSPLLTLACNHKFHLQCLASNIQAQNKECPLCRATIDAAVVQLLTGSRQPPVPPPMVPFGFSFGPRRVSNASAIPSVEDPVDETAVRALFARMTSARQAAGNLPMITVSTTLEYGAQPPHAESNIYGLVTLQAPLAVAPVNSASPGPSRVPIDLVCVVDQSGSMTGEKMRLLKQTLVYITGQLNDLDRLAIISFDTQAFDRSHGLKRMNQQNQQTLVRAINNDIADGGGTYIGCGLEMGINLLNTRRTKNPVGALLLLTDGQDNEMHDYSQLMDRLPADILCYTFGYGPDHMAALLVQLSEKGNNGSFTYVDEEQAVGPAFAMTLGGLFSCIAQQVGVNLEFDGQYAVTHVHSKYEHEPKNLPSQKVTFTLTNLNAEEKRNLTFQLHVPKADNDQAVEMTTPEPMSQGDNPIPPTPTIGQATVSYVDSNSGQTRTTPSVPFHLIRTPNPTADQLRVDCTLDLQRNRVETAREIKRAMDENDYQRSRAILKAQVAKIKASVSSQDPFCQLLIKDLEFRYPSENAYRSSHQNTYMQHSSERGTYAPTTSFSSAIHVSSVQQQQAMHFQQQHP